MLDPHAYFWVTWHMLCILPSNLFYVPGLYPVTIFLDLHIFGPISRSMSEYKLDILLIVIYLSWQCLICLIYLSWQCLICPNILKLLLISRCTFGTLKTLVCPDILALSILSSVLNFCYKILICTQFTLMYGLYLTRLHVLNLLKFQIVSNILTYLQRFNPSYIQLILTCLICPSRVIYEMGETHLIY